MISARNALFSMLTPNGIMRSNVSGTSMFSGITFGSCSHKFSGTGTSKVFADEPADYIINSVVSCVQLF